MAALSQNARASRWDRDVCVKNTKFNVYIYFETPFSIYHDGGGRGEAERAGAGDDDGGDGEEHGEVAGAALLLEPVFRNSARDRRCVPRREDGARQSDDAGREAARGAVSELLDGRLCELRVLHSARDPKREKRETPRHSLHRPHTWLTTPHVSRAHASEKGTLRTWVYCASAVSAPTRVASMRKDEPLVATVDPKSSSPRRLRLGKASPVSMDSSTRTPRSLWPTSQSSRPSHGTCRTRPNLNDCGGQFQRHTKRRSLRRRLSRRRSVVTFRLSTHTSLHHAHKTLSEYSQGQSVGLRALWRRAAEPGRTRSTSLTRTASHATARGCAAATQRRKTVSSAATSALSPLRAECVSSRATAVRDSGESSTRNASEGCIARSAAIPSEVRCFAEASRNLPTVSTHGDASRVSSSDTLSLSRGTTGPFHSPSIRYEIESSNALLGARLSGGSPQHSHKVQSLKARLRHTPSNTHVEFEKSILRLGRCDAPNDTKSRSIAEESNMAWSVSCCACRAAPAKEWPRNT